MLGVIRKDFGDNKSLPIHDTDVLERVLLLKHQSGRLFFGIFVYENERLRELDLSVSHFNCADQIDVAHLADFLEQLTDCLTLVDRNIYEDSSLSLGCIHGKLVGFVHDR